MNSLKSTFSIGAVLAASVLALQAPVATAQTTDQRGVPGVEANVGNNASDRGVPGVEMNVGRQGDQNNAIGRPGDQNNVDIGRNGDQRNLDTRSLGAGSNTMGAGGTYGTNADGTMRPMRTDRN